MIDVHSHILPGIDDGSKSLDQSVNILAGLKNQGFTEVILTPHYVQDTKYCSLRSENLKLLRKLKKVAPKGLKLYLGNELYIDRTLPQLLKKRKISALAGSKYLLVEFPMSGEFDGYEDILDSLRLAGYQVIIAHPERYSISHRDFTFIERLCELGVLFQCNYGSFIGQYGRKSCKIAKKLARRKLIFILGTDIHHERNYDEIKKSLRVLRRFYNDDELEALTTTNPAQIISCKKA